MQELLANPIIQSAIGPFVVALLLALIVRRITPSGVGVAIVGGFLTAVILTTGLSFQPLTATRKIILCSLALPFVLIILDQLLLRVMTTRLRLAIPAIILSAAALWVIWPVLKRQEGIAIVEMALPVGVYALLQMFGAQALGRRTFNEQAAGMLLLAMGTGATAMIVASALYSQLAFAVAAALGAVILLTLFTRSVKPASLSLFVLYAVLVPVTLLATAATVYSQPPLPLLALLCLLFVPLFPGWLKHLPVTLPSAPWLKLTLTCLWSAIPVLPAIWLAWRVAGSVSF